jgi:hypothetical protein
MPSAFLAAHVAVTLLIAPVAPVEPAAVGEPASDSTTGEPAPEDPEVPSEDEPSEEVPSVEETLVEQPPAPLPAPVDDEPAPEDPDAPDLQAMTKYWPDFAELDAATQRRALQRGTVGGLLTGMGLALGVVAPIFVLRPAKAFVVDTGQEGTAVAIATDGRSLAAGLVTGFGGGVLTLLGGHMISDLAVEPARAARRQRSLHVASGIAFGLASGLFVAAVVDAARAGVQWQEVLRREVGPDDLIDGEEVASKASRSLALLSMVPPVLGLGIGLRLGHGAQASVVPTGSGLAVAGRF